MHERLNAVLYIVICALTAMFTAAQKYSASIGRYPYLVSIQNRRLEKYCSGAVITEIHVLTAFTCSCRYNETDVSDNKWSCLPAQSFIVIAGVTNVYMDLSSGQVRRVEAWKFNNDSFYPPNSTHFANFMMLELKTRLYFQASIQPLNTFPLWERFRIRSGIIQATSKNTTRNPHLHPCATVGWEFVKDSVKTATLAVIPTQFSCKCDFDYCKRNPNQSHCVPYCEQPNICGTFRTGEEKYCGGLEGNLLICYAKVLGMVSIPATCSDPRKRIPTVFVRIDEMLDIIHSFKTSRSPTLTVSHVIFFITSVIIIFYDYSYYWSTCYEQDIRMCTTGIWLIPAETRSPNETKQQVIQTLPGDFINPPTYLVQTRKIH